MAKQVIERLVDDIDGSEATQSITFGVDGHGYTIDLNDVHAADLRSRLDPFLEVARRVRDDSGRPRVGVRGIVADKDRNQAIRQWALDEGVELPSRGRIAGSVQQAYDAGDADALYAAVGLEREEEEEEDVVPEPVAPKRSRRKAANAEFSAKE